MREIVFAQLLAHVRVRRFFQRLEGIGRATSIEDGDHSIGAEHLSRIVARLEQSVSAHQQPIAVGEFENLGRCVESAGRHDTQRQVTRHHRHRRTTTVSSRDVCVRQSAAPHFDGAFLKVEIDHGGAAEVTDRQNVFQLAVAFAQHVAQQKTLLRHAVEDLRQRHGTNRCREPVTREVPQQHVHAAGGVARGEYHVAVEHRQRRDQMADVARSEATRVRDAVEDVLCRLLFAQQAFVVPRDLVALLLHRHVQLPHAFERGDLRPQNHAVVRLRHEVVAAGQQTTRQLVRFGERRQENDRNEGIARHFADAARHFEAVEPRHQRVEQNDLRAFGVKLLDGVHAVDRFDYPMALARHDSREQRAVGAVVVRNENSNRFGHERHSGFRTAAKFEIRLSGSRTAARNSKW